MARVILTPAEIAAGLLSQFSLSGGQFTFSIANATSTWNDYAAGEENSAAGYSILNAAQAAAYRAAIAAWDILIARDFTEVVETATARGELRIAFTTMGSGTAGYAYQGSNQTPTSKVGDIWLQSANAGDSYALGTYGYVVLLHEIGHSLGLKHSFEGTVIPAPFESARYTLLSYTQPNPGEIRGYAAQGGGITTTSTTVVVTTPMVLDIAAIQALYGANTNAASGNSTYSFTQGSAQISAIYDAGGTDTIDLSNFTRANIVDMTPGGYSSIGYWTIAEQTAYWQSQFPGYGNFIPDTLAGKYEWVDNLGIALNTVIENLIGGSGNDTVTGNAANNLFYLQRGGVDAVSGGDGNDGAYFGAAFTSADSFDGGAGDDQMALQGNYTLTLGTGSVVGVETLVLMSGADTSQGDTANARYAYNITLNDATIAAGQTLTINSNTLLATESVTINAAAETSAGLRVFNGLGTATLTGGAGNDGFFFGGNGRFGASDTIVGGAGSNDQLGLRGDYSTQIVFAASTLSGIEAIVVLSSTDTRFSNETGAFSYDLKSHNGNVAAGEMLTVTGTGLTTTEVLRFDGSLELDGRFRLWGGKGNDTLTGGTGADEFVGGQGSDMMTGGAGADRFLYSRTTDSTGATGIDTLLDFASGTDRIDLSAIDANNVAGDGNQAFTFLGGRAFTATGAASAGELRVVTAAGGGWDVLGDVDGDGTADLTIHIVGTEPVVTDFIL
ncbi:MAG: M10 family metallopeptidase [Pseudomonadota bacterium]